MINLDLIRFKNVKKTYKNGVTAIQDLTLNIKKGEFVFVIGLTASGKSTLIKMLYREEKPTKGTVIVGGIDVGKLRNGKVYKVRRKIGVVFQDFKLLPKLTAYENVAFVLEMFGYDKKEIRKKTLKALDLVGLKEKVKSYPHELSGGEQQRTSIGRALISRPAIVLADEPTGNLDTKASEEIVSLLKKSNKEMKQTIIMITHNLELAKVADKIIEIADGRIVGEEK